MTQMSMTPEKLNSYSGCFHTTEDYFMCWEQFRDYIDEHVNPARLSAGLMPLDANTTRDAFRILDRFFAHWRSNGVTV
jgi:hypothetical protein